MSQSVASVSTQTGPKTGLATVLTKPNSSFTVEERTYPQPQGDSVRIRLEACGVCHSDSFAVGGQFPGLKYPIVPGHEIVGIVDAVGAEVSRLKVGDRVGVGWHGGHCGHCTSCRNGDFVTCEKLETPGITRDGGYSQYAVFSEKACALVPAGLSSIDAAPLLCAGVTTFNAIRHAGAQAGDTVAVLGIGGLGHLGVQFASKMGFQTVAIARGEEKAQFAKSLGADIYINSDKDDAVETLRKSGGARVILATVTSSKAMSPWVDALAVGGKLVIIGAGFEPLNVAPVQLIGQRKSVVGWPSGTAADSEDCMRFSARNNVRPMVEKFPFKKASEAYERMMSGAARFRVVLEY
jgi:D-arabinose 1-dehydrogenase-like Zn-dependent alcohol dehydrogenase